MIKKTFNPDKSRNCLIEQVIAAPLEAAARANSNMAHEQLAFILKYCFEKQDEGRYSARMIDLLITRQDVVQDENGESSLVTYEATINLPILTIVPLSSLAINKIEIDFDLEVTSMETVSQSKKLTQQDQRPDKSDEQGVNFRGRIGPSRSQTANSNRKEQSKANLEIKLTAGPLPLPTGLLTIMDSLGKQIAPTEVKPKEQTDDTSANAPSQQQ